MAKTENGADRVGREPVAWSPLLKRGALAILLLVVGLGIVHRVLPHSTHSNTAFPAEGPAEFLYLDGDRVLAYLAQFDGGTFTSEQLTHKVSESESSKVSVEDALELGSSEGEEQSLARTITPTAAGNYIELLSKLEALHGLKTIGLGRFRYEVHGLTEGQFVIFRTHALSAPVYLNPYLALRQDRSASTLFPLPRDKSGRAVVRREWKRALHFQQEVGKDPRVVFALRPLNKLERKGRRELETAKRAEQLVTEAGGRAEGPIAATGPKGASPDQGEEPERHLSPHTPSLTPALLLAKTRAEKRIVEKNHVEYLMPMDAQLITQERSLIKFGGGEFTVVGKVVRIFPEHGDDHNPAYVDTPTLETWEGPLQQAPAQLLCRTDPKCHERMRDGSLTKSQREKAVQRSRAWAIEALTEQTEIPRRGAVIVPIAIYK